MKPLSSTLCARLAAEAHEDHGRMTPPPWMAKADALYHYDEEDGATQLAVFSGEAMVDEDPAVARQRNNLAETAEQLDAAAKIGDVVRRLHETSERSAADGLRLVRQDVFEELMALVGGVR